MDLNWFSRQKKGALFLPVVVLTWCFLAAGAEAARIVVLPLEDLSRGANGVNLPLTRFLSQKLEERGEEIVPLEKVIDYLARHRIRWLGFLETKNVRRIRKELDADLVLLGTVSQLQEEPSPVIGLILTAVETGEAGTVWSESGALSCRDVCNILGLAEPDRVVDLQKVLADRLLQAWSFNLDSRGPTRRPQVRSSLIEPENVQPGEQVRCAVRLYPPGDLDLEPFRPRSAEVKEAAGGKQSRQSVQLMVGNNDYLHMEERAANLYEAIWAAPDRNELVPISLILKDRNGGRQIFFLGNYRVDNQPPVFDLKVRSRKVNGRKTFSDSISIIPVWHEPEPISHWYFFIRDEQGEILLSSEGRDRLPRGFKWKGQRPDGYKAADGEYELALRVWDLAENMTEVIETVSLRAQPPLSKITVARKEDHFAVTVDYESDVPLSRWTGRLHFENGETILEKQGSTLPVTLQLPRNHDEESSRLQGTFTLRDVLGNRIRKVISNLEGFVPHDMEREDSKAQGWLEEF